MNIRNHVRFISSVYRFELALLLPLFGWSLWMLSPWWNSLGSPSYAQMSFWSHTTWGVVTLVITVLHLIGMWKGVTFFRRKMLLVSMAFWVMLAWMIATANFSSTGVPTYSSLAILNAMTYLRIKHK